MLMIKLQRRSFITAITLAPFIPLIPVTPEQLTEHIFYRMSYAEDPNPVQIEFENIREDDIILMKKDNKPIFKGLAMEDWNECDPEGIHFQKYDDLT